MVSGGSMKVSMDFLRGRRSGGCRRFLAVLALATVAAVAVRTQDISSTSYTSSLSPPDDDSVRDRARVTRFLNKATLARSALTPFFTSTCSRGCRCEPPGSPTSVDCSGSGLDVVPHDLPPMVTRLNLDRNRLRRLEEGLLSQYENLEVFSAAANQVASVAGSATFAGLRRLTVLDLSSNRIGPTFVGRLQRDLANLEELYLASNSIETIEFSGGGGSRLRVLDLEANKLTHLAPGAFANVADSLQVLRLSRNLFAQLPALTLWTLPNLVELDFSDNLVYDLIPAAEGASSSSGEDDVRRQQPFAGCRRLSRLSLRGCALRSLGPSRSSLTGLNSLTSLDVSNNKLRTGSAAGWTRLALGMLDHLEELHMGMNLADAVGEADMRAFPNLRTLTLEGCVPDVPLILQPDAFRGNAKLRTVNVTKCPGLTALRPGTLHDLPDLRTLNLRSNGLANVSFKAADWAALGWFDLSGNPIDCGGCGDSRFLADAYRALYRKVPPADVPAAHCGNPRALQGRPLHTLTTDDLVCDLPGPDGGGDGGAAEDPRPGGTDHDPDEMSPGMISLIVGVSLTLTLMAVALAASGYACYRRRTCGNPLRLVPEVLRDRAAPDAKPPRGRNRKQRPFFTPKDIRVQAQDVGDVPGFLDIKRPQVEELEDEEDEVTENLYEEPIGPPGATTYPNIKLTSI